MKHLSLVAFIIGLGLLTRAQTGYEVVADGKGKLLKGVIRRDILENDTAFHWLHNKEGYTPNQETVDALKAKTSSIRFLVFLGTWCEDSQNLLPKFFALMDAAGIGDDQIMLIAVDRQKKSIHYIPEMMHLVSTPTFVVLELDQEKGRVVEYGKNGQWEQELREIAAKVAF